LRSQRWLEGTLRSDSESQHWVTIRGTSMSPTASPGDRLLVTSLSSDAALHAGELVVVSRNGRLVAHRLISSTADLVVTKGDAGLENDGPVRRSDVVGRVVAIRRVGHKT
jgi:signal peptidase I